MRLCVKSDNLTTKLPFGSHASFVLTENETLGYVEKFKQKVKGGKGGMRDGVP